jgi:hypothetical protein
MRNALSIAAGASSEISVAKMLSTDRLKLIRPSPSVTGSISFKTLVTRSSRQSNERTSLNPVRRSHGSGSRS